MLLFHIFNTETIDQSIVFKTIDRRWTIYCFQKFTKIYKKFTKISVFIKFHKISKFSLKSTFSKESNSYEWLGK